MTTARMLLSSVILTVCLATIGIVFLLFTGDKSPLKNDEKNETDTSIEETIPPALADESVEEEALPVVMEGHRSETDALGVHDILFESGPTQWQTTSGPVTLTVTEVKLERLTADDPEIIKAVEGRVPATIAVFSVQIENTSTEPVMFKIDETKITVDTGEHAVVNPKLSTIFGDELASNTRKSGVLMVDLASNTRDIASLTLKMFPAYDVNYEELGEAVELKVPMY